MSTVKVIPVPATAGVTLTLVSSPAANAPDVPVIPAVTDTDANVDAIGRFVSSLDTRPGVTLLPHHATAMAKYTRFRVDKRLPDGLGEPSKKELMDIISRLAGYGLEVSC